VNQSARAAAPLWAIDKIMHELGVEWVVAVESFVDQFVSVPLSKFGLLFICHLVRWHGAKQARLCL